MHAQTYTNKITPERKPQHLRSNIFQMKKGLSSTRHPKYLIKVLKVC